MYRAATYFSKTDKQFGFIYTSMFKLFLCQMEVNFLLGYGYVYRRQSLEPFSGEEGVVILRESFRLNHFTCSCFITPGVKTWPTEVKSKISIDFSGHAT